MNARGKITQLLEDWGNGDQGALDKLMPLVYQELQRLARSYLRHERTNHTFQTADLINEAYIRLFGPVEQHENGQGGVKNRPKDRDHFFRLAARLMRNILVDYARKHNADKRGGRAVKLPLDEALNRSDEQGLDLKYFLALDEALERLAIVDPLASQIFELRYFGGLKIKEIAEFLQMSVTIVKEKLKLAKTWLLSEISK